MEGDGSVGVELGEPRVVGCSVDVSVRGIGALRAATAEPGVLLAVGVVLGAATSLTEGDGVGVAERRWLGVGVGVGVSAGVVSLGVARGDEAATCVGCVGDGSALALAVAASALL